MAASRPLPSIRTRLSRAIVVVALAWGGMLTLTVGWLLHSALGRLLDSGLQESAEMLYGMVQLGAADLGAAGGMLPAPRHDEALIWQLVGAQGQVVLHSHQAPAQALVQPVGPGLSSTTEWRIYAMPLAQARGMLLVAQSARVRAGVQYQIMGGSLGVALLVGLLSTLWLKRRLRKELTPLQDLSEAVGHFDPMAPGANLPRAARAELQPMVEAIRGLGQRLSAHVAHERAFAAHAAHALRTPLAGIDAQLAVALREAPQALQPRLRQTREAASRLRSVVSALISLFRAGGQTHWQRVALPELVQRLPVRGVAVTVDAPEPVHCDPDLLSAALMNLMDNATRHEAQAVHVWARPHAGGHRIEVKDDGHGMRAQRLSEVQAALRAGVKQEGVLGLGLTLADLVVRTHGGHIAIDQTVSTGSGTGGGVTVTLWLPAAPA